MKPRLVIRVPEIYLRLFFAATTIGSITDHHVTRVEQDVDSIKSVIAHVVYITRESCGIYNMEHVTVKYNTLSGMPGCNVVIPQTRLYFTLLLGQSMRVLTWCARFDRVYALRCFTDLVWAGVHPHSVDLHRCIINVYIV